jgi:hypothetical protein
LHSFIFFSSSLSFRSLWDSLPLSSVVIRTRTFQSLN